MADKPSVLRPTDDAALQQARILLRSCRYASLAVLDPDTGWPHVSRVLTGTDIDGVPVILVSGLAHHTKALLSDKRCSLLAGEPAKGDPLAWARLMVQCEATRVDREDSHHAHLRQRFIRRHPKSALYIDFPDFMLFRLQPLSALLNGGFGRAFQIDGADLVIQSDSLAEFAKLEIELIENINQNEQNLIAEIMNRHSLPNVSTAQVCGIDVAGMDIRARDSLYRIEFNKILADFLKRKYDFSALKSRIMSF